MIDQNIRWEVIRGRLPLSIQLDQSEVASTTCPTPYFGLTPRVSYLPQLLPGLHRHFESFRVPSYGRSIDPWMDFEGIPLDWRVPIGVLFDTLCALNHQLPWKLTVHFNAMPDFGGVSGEDQSPYNNVKISLPNWSEFQQHHLNLMKQSLCIFHGHGKAFGNLNNEIQLKLFDAIRRVDQRLFDHIWFNSLLGTDLNLLRRVPIRVYLAGRSRFGRLTSYVARNSRLDPHELTTLHDWLVDFLPVGVPPENLEVVVQGVAMCSLSAPLVWVALMTLCLDGFLHITLRPRVDIKTEQDATDCSSAITNTITTINAYHSPFDSYHSSTPLGCHDPSAPSWCSTTGSETDSICVSTSPARYNRTNNHPIVKPRPYIDTKFGDVSRTYRRSLRSDFFCTPLDNEIILRLRSWKMHAIKKCSSNLQHQEVNKNHPKK